MNGNFKYVAALLAVLGALIWLFAAPSWGASLDVRTWVLVAPQGNEPIIGDHVERGEVGIEPRFVSKYLRLSSPVRAHYGVRWEPDRYHWSHDKMYYSWNPELEVGSDQWPVHLLVDHYTIYQRHQIRGHGRETEYYWRVGVRSRFFTLFAW